MLKLVSKETVEVTMTGVYRCYKSHFVKMCLITKRRNFDVKLLYIMTSWKLLYIFEIIEGNHLKLRMYVYVSHDTKHTKV